MMVACGGESASNKAAATDDEAIVPTENTAEKRELGYQLHKPDMLYTLPGSLQEISGMQNLDDKRVACVQDEKGIIYIFDREEGKISREIKWGPNGDYEGLAGSAEALYVLESSGIIYKISDFLSTDAPTVSKWEVPLETPCNAEGLSMSADGKSLLIVCKEGVQGVRKVWAFDLNSQQLKTKPYRQIKQKALEDMLLTDGLDRFSLGLKKVLDIKGESGILAPSGLAIHPLTGDYYILSAVSSLLTVLNSSGEVKHIEELPVSLFLHPESITFTSSGDLLIGNEGKGGEPNILLFTYDKVEK